MQPTPTPASLLPCLQAYKVPSAAPAVAFGGSYGGNIAAYLRLTYPNDFTAALASGAVVKMLAPSEPFEEVKFKSYEVSRRALLVLAVALLHWRRRRWLSLETRQRLACMHSYHATIQHCCFGLGGPAPLPAPVLSPEQGGRTTPPLPLTFPPPPAFTLQVLSDSVRQAGSEACADAVQLGFETLAELGASSSGRKQLEQAVG